MSASEVDDADLLAENPMLAYLAPGRFAKVSRTYSFPFHTNLRL